MNEDFVSYEQALALKKAGFDEPCRYYYNPKGVLRPAKDNALSPEALNNRYLDEIADGVCSAVPLWQAQKWLREVKRVEVNASFDSNKSYWFFYLNRMDVPDILNPEDISDPVYSTYEQALSAVIDAALELIEKKGE